MTKTSPVQKRRRSSIVPSMLEVGIDTSHPAPQSGMRSLDFDRIVNAYSIIAVKKRLVLNANLVRNQSERRRQGGTRPLRNHVVNTYESFQGLDDGEDKRGVLHTPHGKNYVRWALTMGMGIASGTVACLLVFCTSHIINFRTSRLNWQLQMASGTASVEEYEAFYNSGDPSSHFGYHSIFHDFTPQHDTAWVLLEYILYNMVLAMISALLCIFFAPNAVGSGIPEVKAYLNGVSVESFADLNVFLTKILGTIFAVSSGLIVGPEGPLVHIGAIVGLGITKTTRLEKAMRQLQQQYPDASRVFGCGKVGEVEYLADVVLEPSFDKFLKKTGSATSFEPLYEVDSEGENEEDDNEMINLCVSELHNANNKESSSNISYQQQQQAETNKENGKRHKTEKYNNTYLTDLMNILACFRNDCDRRDLITIGVATGFATAFGAPVGGLLYSLEEASSYFTIPLMWRTLVATAIGTFAIAIYHGDLSHFSILLLGDRTVVEGEKAVGSSFLELPTYILVGAMGGLLGAFFNGCYIYINTRRGTFYSAQSSEGKSNLYRLFEVMYVSFLTSLVSFCLSVYVPESWACSDVSNIPKSDAGTYDELYFAARFNCPKGQFNEIATILLGSRDEALNDIFTDPSKFKPATLLVSGLAFLFFMVITFGIFIPSGLFMPTLLTGSALSAYASLIIQQNFLPNLVPEHLAIVGATAMLAGIQRTTVSLCVIMMEATGQTKVLVPLIIAVVVARYVGDLFNDGFYHINMHMKHYPFLVHEIKETFDICAVSEVMTSPVVTFHGIEEAHTIEEVLHNTDYEAFPVLDHDTNTYSGMISRDKLIALLEVGIYFESLEELPKVGNESRHIRKLMTDAEMEHIDRSARKGFDLRSASSQEKSAAASKKWKAQHEWLYDNVFSMPGDGGCIVITAETLPRGANLVMEDRDSVVNIDKDGKLVANVPDVEKFLHVDIAAAMNRGAFTVTQNCPLSKAYSLFAAMGLRHLPVLGIDGAVVGMITRSNLDPNYMEQRTGVEMHH